VPLAVEVSSDGSGGYHQIEGHAVLLCIVLCLSCNAAQHMIEEMESIGGGIRGSLCEVGRLGTIVVMGKVVALNRRE